MVTHPSLLGNWCHSQTLRDRGVFIRELVRDGRTAITKEPSPSKAGPGSAQAFPLVVSNKRKGVCYVWVPNRTHLAKRKFPERVIDSSLIISSLSCHEYCSFNPPTPTVGFTQALMGKNMRSGRIVL